MSDARTASQPYRAIIPEGLLLIHKPAGMTSHDVVEVVRHKLGIRQIGHTGTLDPMAEGLLMLLVGKATKQQSLFQRHEKRYEAVLRLGIRTDTGDAAGQAIQTAPVPPVDRERIIDVLSSLRGSMSQTPPAYSAIKVQGRPAYWWARQHRPVTLAARTITVDELELVEAQDGVLRFRVRCSAGTYIRTLAEEIARRLETVGHLTKLVRLDIGDWGLAQAKPLSWIREASREAVICELLPVPVAAARHPALALHARQ